MVTALPAGWLADRHRRDTLLRCGAGVGAAAGALLAWALARAPTVWALAASMALLGCYRGVYSAALEAIFADSVTPGRRWGCSRGPGCGSRQEGRAAPAAPGAAPASRCQAPGLPRTCALLLPFTLPPSCALSSLFCSSVYTYKYIVTVGASSFGPWLSLLLFQRLGNRWDERDCRAVLLSGVAVMAVPLALMCCFDDDKAEEGSTGPAAAAAAAAAAPAIDAEAAHTAEATAEVPAGSAAPTPADSSSDLVSLLDGDAGDASGGGGEPQCGCCGCCASWPSGLVVTVLISVSDFLGAFASG